ncbi:MULTISPECIES: hypothetical protein [unclassified Bradyrhizobium]|uniref:hypothetical protein n=1 Tax=unclassified Bradyrhizobium TaxID=2631580 RepID=UPI0012EC1D17|nr:MULTISPECIES: hypothetical protein [unclassified Bradyrhizobium]MCP3462264.1 hypothetical protein [Bradyrhizobium sp. CCGUVB23]
MHVSREMLVNAPFPHALVQRHQNAQDTENEPAIAAGVSQTLWSMDDLCEKMDAVAPKPGKRSPYKKHVAVTL